MKKIITTLMITTLGLSVLSGCQQQNNGLDLNSHTQQDVANTVHKEFPMIPLNSMTIEQNKDLNMWQVYALGQVMYVTPNLSSFIGGHYFKFDGSKTDLTQKYIDTKNIIDVKTLPMDLALKTTKGNGKNVFYVFSDPECPYCHMLQSEVINKLDNTTVYTFLFPLPIHPTAYGDSVKIICDKESSNKFESWMSVKPDDQASQHDKYFAKMSECAEGKAKVDKLLQLGQTLNISGTPTIINVQGQKLGMRELAMLSKQQSESGVK